MPNSVFPLQKPSMSLEQAFAQAIAFCQAGQWQEAESLYQAIVLNQPSPMQGQYWLSYIDALIQAGKPVPTAADASMQQAQVVQEVKKAQEVQEAAEPAQEIPVSIKLAKLPNPRYTARQPRWPWKMALGAGHVPGRRQIHLLLAHYQRAQYDEAAILARSLTHVFPHHDLGWKVLIATLQMQGRMADAQQAQEQRRISRAARRRNLLPA